jgi:hypothetical protein
MNFFLPYLFKASLLGFTYNATGTTIDGGYTSENFSLVKGAGSRATSLDPNQPSGSVPGLAPGYSNESGNVTSLTQSGVSGGAITITDYLKQQTLTGQTAEQTVANPQPHYNHGRRRQQFSQDLGCRSTTERSGRQRANHRPVHATSEPCGKQHREGR